jgi:hypothetical protein
MKEYYGNYLGIVITGGEKDPDHRGRVQIFIPHIMPALYEEWNQKGEDITFEVIGEGLDGSLNPIIVEKLRKILPWSECAVPITGASPSYKGNTSGFVSEVVRNVGSAAEAALSKAKDFLGLDNNTQNATSNDRVVQGDQATALALTQSVAAAEKSGAGNCGRGVFNILTDAYGYSASIGSANGQDWGDKFDQLKFKKYPIKDPRQAPPGSFLVYDSDDRRGQPRTLSRKTGKPTGGSQYGHVETVGADGKFYFGTTPAINPGGSVPHNFSGYYYLPPEAAQLRALDKAGLPNVSPSALPHAAPTTSIDPSPTKEQSAAAALDKQMTPDAQAAAAAASGQCPGLPEGVTKNELIMAMRIAAAESGVGVPGADVKNQVFNLGRQVTNAFAFGGNNTATEKYSNFFPNKKDSSGLEFIKQRPDKAHRVDTGYIQCNNDDKKLYGLQNSGSYSSQVTSLAKHIAKQTAKDPQFKSLVNSAKTSSDFKKAESYKRPGGKHPIPAYNLDTEARLSAGAKDAFQAELNKTFGGDPCAALAAYDSQYPSAPSVQEMMGSDYKEPDVPSSDNQAITQTPTPHHGISGPNTNNQALGMFGYASEGQAVWVFFRDGNPLFPVYFAASFGSKEWGNIYQNASDAFGSGTKGTEKFMANFYGGGFSSSSSTNESPLGEGFAFQLFDKNGSNLTFAKDHTQFNSMYNHVQRVLGDNHDIVEANKEIRVRGNFNNFVEQDLFVTVGNWTQEAIDASDEIQKIINEAMDAKSQDS